MKLKYLLRGIGIGAVLAAAIMYFVYGKADNVLSDDEIRARARELGMMRVGEFQYKELSCLKDMMSEKSEIKPDEKTGDKIEETGKKTDIKDKTSSTTSKLSNTPSKENGDTGLSTETGDKANKTSDAKGNSAGTSENRKTEGKAAKAGDTKDGNSTDNKAKTGDTKNEEAKSGNTEGKKIVTKSQMKPAKEINNAKAISGKVSFSVAAGMSSEKVSASLKALGLIDDSAKFNKYLVNNGYASKIRIGTFEFQRGQSYAEIAAKLVK